MSDPVDYVPFETTTAPQAPAAGDPVELERLYDVPVELAVEIGRTRMTIRETLALGPGSIVTLDRLAGEPVDLLVNGKPIARGEVVVIDEEFGLRVTEVTSPNDSAGEPQHGAAYSGAPAGGVVAGETQYTGQANAGQANATQAEPAYAEPTQAEPAFGEATVVPQA
jgi:flagellar motor switch protein FliN/FliY